MLRAVLDTNVFVAARRSRSGASNALVRAALQGKLRILVSVPLFLEYEAVLVRPRHLQELGLTAEALAAFLDLLARRAEEVQVHYLWRPQLADVADEMVLETAINGRADYVVTFNGRHFEAASRFGIGVATPAEMMRLIT